MSHVGCHVSIAGGVDKAPEMASKFGCEVMQIFTRPPMGGKNSELTADTKKQFKLATESCGLKAVYVHAPYYINFASGNTRIRYSSISAIKIELNRASALGAKYVMTHLGSAKDIGEKEAIKKTIEGLKKVLDGYKGTAKLLIENSAGAGKIIGANFKDIEKILSEVKSAPGGDALAGICLDTQHAFASGYLIDEQIKLKNIKLIHTNDSLSDLASRVDRHAHIGKGKIGLDAFKKIAKFARENKIDLICETNYPEVIEDIKIIKTLVK